MTNLIGNVLLNRFRIDSQITSDDSSTVFRSLDFQNNSHVSVRVLHLSPGDSPSVVRSIQQVESTLKNLTHPGIVSYLGLFQSQDLVFLEEKLIEANSLRDMLQKRPGRQMPPAESVVYIKAMGEILEFLHNYGLIYCNLRPENILIDRSGSIMLTNFSAARHSESARITQAISCSPNYIAPELARGESITAATDIYGLGLLLFELLTGQPPFPGTDGESARQAHLNSPVPNPRSLNPNIPPGMDQVINTALAKNPRDRYQSIQEMMEIICAVLGMSLNQIPSSFKTQTQVMQSDAVMPATMVVQPGLSPQAQVGGAAYVEAQYAGTQRADFPATQVAAPSYGEVPSDQYGTAPYADTPYAPPQEAKKQPMLWVIIGVVVAALLLCAVVFVVVGLPLIQGEPTATNTNTPTLTATITQTSAPVILPTIPPPPTEPPSIPPTEPPPPTEAPIIPSPTPPPQMPAFFKVTIYNNSGAPVYAFRDGQIMGTDPIPPGKYIWYKSIPPGPHVFFFCADPIAKRCFGEKQVMVDKDLDIYVK